MVYFHSRITIYYVFLNDDSLPKPFLIILYRHPTNDSALVRHKFIGQIKILQY